jgi:hypothetical protein
MRLRVRLRFREETGAVEVFLVEEVGDTPTSPDHDLRHERAAHDVARLIDRNALIEEVAQTPAQPGRRTGEPRNAEEEPRTERQREEPQA